MPAAGLLRRRGIRYAVAGLGYPSAQGWPPAGQGDEASPPSQASATGRTALPTRTTSAGTRVPVTTPPATCRFSRGSRRSASDPGMYIGSTDQRGLMHCLWEIIDNAVDEALAGHCDRIEVILHADGSVEVRDNGRGIPVDIEPRTGLTGVEVVFTKLHAGGKFGGGSYTASGGLHGVGASVVNALSARLDVEVDRGGKTYAMSFRRGEPGRLHRPTPGHIARRPRSRHTRPVASCGSSARRRAARPAPGSASGPTTRSSSRTPTSTRRHAARPRPPDLVPRPRPDASSSVTSASGRATAADRVESLPVTSAGSAEFAEFLAAGPGGHRRAGGCTGRATSPRPCRCSTTGAHDAHRGRARVRRRHRACGGAPGYDTKVASFVNIIATPKGGTHIAGFEQALLKVLPPPAEVNARRLKVGTTRSTRTTSSPA